MPLKVLWIWNQKEETIAVDFFLEEGGGKYQVKESGINALDTKGNLMVCITENINAVSPVPFDQDVFIEDKAVVDDALVNWNEKGGEKNFKEKLNAAINAQQRIDLSVESEKNNSSSEDISLSASQVSDLVFEMETLIEIKKSLKGGVSAEELDNFIKSCTEGFTQETIDRVRNDLSRKGILS